MGAVKELERRKTSLNLLSTEGIMMRLRAMEPAERALTFRLLEKEKTLKVFELRERSEQNEFLRAMEDPQLVGFLGQLDAERQAELPAKVVKRVLRELPEEAWKQVIPKALICFSIYWAEVRLHGGGAAAPKAPPHHP